MAVTVAFIGTGDPDGEGAAMAYLHARAYESIEDCDLLACADLVPANALAFAAEFEIDEEHVYEDYRALLAAVEPDLVSVCVPPAAHADIVVGCARSGNVGAIHCEKPMAMTWGDSRRMASEADRHDVRLTFNHQRRFGPPWRRAKELLDDGEIGELERVESAAPNLFDWGTHAIDLCHFFTDESAVEWVIGQLDYREESVVFGARQENQALALWEYENGVHGLASTGAISENGVIDCGLVDCLHRLEGSEGTIEIERQWGNEHPELRIRRAGDAHWEAIELEEGDAIEGALSDVVRAIRQDGKSELCARNALSATEVIFAARESSRCRGRVDLPLTIEDNPLEAMVEAGELRPEAGD